MVARMSPPITARPRGAFCSPPSPSPRAIGAIPIIIARAVIRTGLNLVKPASKEALTEFLEYKIRSRAKLTTKILFAVATPMHMMAPVRAGTDQVVWVAKSIQIIPAKAAGRALTITKGSLQD